MTLSSIELVEAVDEACQLPRVDAAKVSLAQDYDGTASGQSSVPSAHGLPCKAMDFDGSSLLASLVVSCVGYVVFRYGRTQRRLPQVAVGMTLMIFPYFVSDALSTMAIGAVLLAGLWLACRFGL